LAGAALVAVPVATAAAIGFGTSFSGLTGGISELASGPADDGAITPTAAPAGRGLDRTLISLSGAPAGGGGDGGGGGGGADRGDTNVVQSPGGTGGGTQTGGSTGNGGGGGGLPGVSLPGGGGGGPIGGGGGGGTGDPVGDVIDSTGVGGLLP